MIGQRNGAFGRGIEFEIGLRTVEHVREFSFANLDILAAHIGQLAIDLPNHHEVRLAGGAGIDQLGRDVGIGAEAVAHLAIHLAPRHQLGNEIDLAVENIAPDICIIGADIIRLRPPHAAPAAGEEEEFIDLDIGRQRALAQSFCIVEGWIFSEQTIERRLKKATLQLARWRRPLQGQRRENAQVQAGIGHCARHQGVDDVIGLAQSKRDGEDNRAADRCNDRIDQGVRITVGLWSGRHQMTHSVLARNRATKRPGWQSDMMARPRMNRVAAAGGSG